MLLAALHAGCQQTGGISNVNAQYPPNSGYQVDPFTGMAMKPNPMMPGGSPYGNPNGLTLAQYSMASEKGAVTTLPMNTGPMVPGAPGQGSPLLKPGATGDYVKALQGADSVMLWQGCSDMPTPAQLNAPPPTELAPVSLPPYTVAPPDILIIDAGPLFPHSYQIQPFDVLGIIIFQPTTPGIDADPAKKALKEPLVAGDFKVTPEGKIILPILGSPTAVKVSGLTVEQATKALHDRLSQALKNVDVFIELKQFRPIAQFQKAEYLVRPDGTISLGTYGYVYVAGMTLGQIKTVVEKHLEKYVANPMISVDVRAYNSKKYYLIIDGGGYGQLVFAYPYTGNEMVMDAVSRLQGLPWWASKKKIWVARPAPCGHPCSQILPVDWNAITQAGQTCTNWQLFPGDRIYVRADALVETNNWIQKVLSPINQVLNSILLGASIHSTLQNNGNGTTSAIVVH
jgi:polysaccharide export outer membrane protein